MFGVRLINILNRLFPAPKHPFNLELAGRMSYGEWQYSQAPAALEQFRDFIAPDAIIKDARVLDLGSGGGGKTTYYATLGPQHIWGIDIHRHYEAQARALSRAKGVDSRVTFDTSDGRHLPFDDRFFDVIIMNDTFEHLSDAAQVLEECARILRVSGRLYINFPPYHHPHGAHLTDVIGIPWVHLFASERTLARCYHQLIADLPDYEERKRLKLDPEGGQLPYLNRMTTRRFQSLVGQSPFRLLHYHEEPLRPFLAPLARIPGLKEAFIRMVVAVLVPR